MEIAEGFKERYSEFLKEYKLNPNKLADELGDKAKVKYHRYSTGETEPGFSTLQLIAAKYPISLDWLIMGQGTMERTEAIEATVTSNENAVQVVDKDRQELLQKLALLEKENHMLRAENKKLWKLNLPESAHKELDFLMASSQTTVYVAPGFKQGYQMRIKGTDYTRTDRPMITPDISKGYPCRLSKGK